MRPAILALDDPTPTPPPNPFVGAILYGVWRKPEIAWSRVLDEDPLGERAHGNPGPIIREYVTSEEAMAEAAYLQELYGDELVVTVVVEIKKEIDAWDRVVAPMIEFEDP
jgi:hypothetical protein